MSDPKFTPSALRLRAERVMPRCKLVHPKPTHYVVAPDGYGNRVAAATFDVDGNSAEQIARLVAAAPELYAALQACEAWMVEHGVDRQPEAFIPPCLAQARSALGKAVVK